MSQGGELDRDGRNDVQLARDLIPHATVIIFRRVAAVRGVKAAADANFHRARSVFPQDKVKRQRRRARGKRQDAGGMGEVRVVVSSVGVVVVGFLCRIVVVIIGVASSFIAIIIWEWWIGGFGGLLARQPLSPRCRQFLLLVGWLGTLRRFLVRAVLLLLTILVAAVAIATSSVFQSGPLQTTMIAIMIRRLTPIQIFRLRLVKPQLGHAAKFHRAACGNVVPAAIFNHRATPHHVAAAVGMMAGSEIPRRRRVQLDARHVNVDHTDGGDRCEDVFDE
mmetsp:Transcript_4191/g.8715  ORF Transcript_4191/g.8715 Transcript_4191/m.8715 type:complete len:278 (+) Transcript_4191:1718-2551(+)